MLQNLWALIGNAEHLTTLLKNAAEVWDKVNGPGTPAAVRQERLQKARMIVGRVIAQLATRGTIDNFLAYLTDAGLVWRNGLTQVKRTTRFTEEKVITAIANMAFLPVTIDETQLPFYEARVDTVIQELESGLVNNQITRAQLDVLIDAAIEDSFIDFIRDAGHAGIYFLKFVVNPQLTTAFTAVNQEIVVKATAELRKIETSVTAWADQQVANSKDARPWWRKLVEFWND